MNMTIMETDLFTSTRKKIKLKKNLNKQRNAPNLKLAGIVL